MKTGLTLLVLATAFASSAMAKEGDVSTQSRESVISTSIVEVGNCNITPNLNYNGGFYTKASVNFLKCEEVETYNVQVTEKGTWESNQVVRIAGSEKRSYRLVRDSSEFSDINSQIQNGQDTYVDSDMNGDGKITKGERRRANEARQDQAIDNAIGDMARASIGTLQVTAQCNNHEEQLRMQMRSNSNLPIECRR